MIHDLNLEHNDKIGLYFLCVNLKNNFKKIK
jgi:hypothetical protein